MGDLKTTAEERAAPRWCADCGAWQPGKVCPVAGVLHHEGMTYTMAAHTHLRYCIDEGDDRVCHKDLRDALDELDQLVPERDTLRAELARLTAPAEGEPTPGQLLDACPPSGGVERLLSCYRLGVAHERARLAAAGVTVATAEDAARFEVVQPVPRATDEELVAIGHEVGKAHIFEGVPEGRGNTWEAWRKECDLAIVRAVAARVRGERCLVAQAVARSWYLYLCPQKNEPSKWDIETGRVIAGRSDGGAILHGVPAADVPATLARLLGEVAR